MSDLKTTIENAIQRTVEEMITYDEITVKRYLVETSHTGPLPKTRWMVYEFPEYVACVPDGELLTSPAVKCYELSKAVLKEQPEIAGPQDDEQIYGKGGGFTPE